MSEIEIIITWLVGHFPEASPKELKEKSLDHYAEWVESRTHYNDIEEYFEEVEESGDFF